MLPILNTVIQSVYVPSKPSFYLSTRLDNCYNLCKLEILQVKFTFSSVSCDNLCKLEILQVRFTFSSDGLELFMPPPYSTAIQVELGCFHLLLA
jgi:hypothetical protein